MKIDDAGLIAFRRDFEELMEQLGEKHDITISLGNITYYENHFTAQLTVKNGRDPEAIARADFGDNVWKYEHVGLKKGMYNRMFIGEDGEKYVLKGLNTRRSKYPLIIYSIEREQIESASEYFIDQILNMTFIDS